MACPKVLSAVIGRNLDVDVFFSFPLIFYLQADGKDSQPFHLTVGKLEEGLKRAKQEVINECIVFSEALASLAEYLRKAPDMLGQSSWFR